MAKKFNNKHSKHYDNSRISNVPTSQQRVNSKNARIEDGVFVYSQEVTLAELAAAIGVPSAAIIKTLFLQGKMVTINSKLEDDIIGTICLQYDLDFRKDKVVSEQHFEDIVIEDNPEDLVERAPVDVMRDHS